MGQYGSMMSEGVMQGHGGNGMQFVMMAPMGMQGQMQGGVLGQIPNGGAPGVVMMMGPHGGMQQLPPQQQQQLMSCLVGAGGNVPTQSGAAMFVTGQGAIAGSGS